MANESCLQGICESFSRDVYGWFMCTLLGQEASYWASLPSVSKISNILDMSKSQELQIHG